MRVREGEKLWVGRKCDFDYLSECENGGCMRRNDICSRLG